MKNNFITKIIGATLAFAMMIGGAVGINAAKQAKPVHAATNTVSYEVASSATIFGATISSVNGTSTGTVQLTDGADTSYDLVGVCKLEALKSGKSDYRSMSNGYAQIGSSSARIKLVLTAADIPDTISSVDVDAYGSAHTMTVKIGGTSYYSEVLSSSAPANPINVQPNASGALEITFAATSYKALYFKSLSVTYGDAAAANTHPVTFDSDGGSAVLTQNVEDSGTAEEPANPTKRGYTFGGWYDNPQRSGETYDFDNTPVTDSVTLYAKWNKVAETASYSLALSDGDYRLKGEVTAITGSSEFFIQSGNNVMHVGGSNFTSTLHNGNSVDLFGTYSASGATISNLAYCDKDTEDTTVEQSYISSLVNVTDANLCKYFRIDGIQLNSGFDGSKKATIKGSELIIFYNAVNCVNGGEFNYNDFSANDYVAVQGVIYRQNSTLGLYITNIEKMTTYVVSFNSNEGTPVDSQIVLAGGQAERPADPTRDSDEEYNYTFAGWYDETLTIAYDFDSAVYSSFTLYAKWNQTELTAPQAVSKLKTQTKLSYHYTKNENNATDTLTHDLIGVEGTSYTTWSNKTDSSDAVYAGQSAGGTTTSGDTIQLRSSNSNSGIVTTQTGGLAKKITVVWNSATSNGNKVDVYGKNSAYTNPTQLYNDAQGTKIGSIVKGTSTELTISDDYAYIGLRSYSGAIYINSIEIEWETVSYSYSNISIRFGGLLSKTLWNRLDTNEHVISGFGVMIASGEALNENELIKENLNAAKLADANPAPSIDEADIVDYYMSKAEMATPVEQGDNYVWNLFQQIDEADVAKVFVAVAYIKVGNEYVFMKQVRYSAKTLAADYIANRGCNSETAAGSLAALAA